MNTTTDQPRRDAPGFVLLEGVPWSTYEAILDAVGEYHLRHVYDRGALEMRSVLYGVTWEDYLKLLAATGDLYLRHTYDQGTLDMMSPNKDHDWVVKPIARMIEALALAFDLPIQSIGSTTLRATPDGRGIQPDESYYLASEPQVRCKETYEPEKDPPPDLALEVDITSSSVPRMPVLAAIGVPELWRIDRSEVRFYRRKSDTEYEEITHSIAFPFLTPDDLLRFLRRRREIGENGVIREFIHWAKQVWQREAE